MSNHDEEYDDDVHYSEKRDGYFRDITTMSEEERQDWRDSDLDSYETNMARQIHAESAKALSTDHPVSPLEDSRVADLEEDRHAHGGPNAIIAARMKERESRNVDPHQAGDCIRTIKEDIEMQASRLRKKFNIE